MLVKGYFESHDEALVEDRKRFQISSGYCCWSGGELVHNGGWYNQAGQRIGWGDMTGPRMLQMAQALQPGEMVIVLNEGAKCGWPLKDRGLKYMPFDFDEPGSYYVFAHVRYVIYPGRLQSAMNAGQIQGVQFDPLDFIELREWMNLS